MEKMALEKKALGCLNEVCSIMCHNYTTWQMSSYWEGCFHPIEKKLALLVSEAKPLHPPDTHAHSLASYLTNEPTKGPLHCLQRPIERERWHVHMQLSPVYSEYKVSVCVCVCAFSHAILCTFPVRPCSFSISVFPPSHTQTHKDAHTHAHTRQ